MYITSPDSTQRLGSRLCSPLTIFCAPCHVGQPGLLHVNRKGAAQQNGSGKGPGGRGWPFLSIRLWTNRLTASTVTIVHRRSTASWIAEGCSETVGGNSMAAIRGWRSLQLDVLYPLVTGEGNVWNVGLIFDKEANINWASSHHADTPHQGNLKGWGQSRVRTLRISILFHPNKRVSHTWQQA